MASDVVGADTQETLAPRADVDTEETPAPGAAEHPPDTLPELAAPPRFPPPLLDAIHADPVPAGPPSTMEPPVRQVGRLRRWGQRVGAVMRAVWSMPPASLKAMDRLGGFVAFLGFAACAYLSSTTMRHFPNSADEADYIWVSERLLEGRLSLPPPAVPDAVSFWWRMVHDGKLVCQYPPSWPALIAPFTWVGAPWLANCVIAGFIVWLMYLLGRHAYGSAATGLVAALWMATNPMHLFNGAAFFPHPATILFGAVALLLVWQTVFGQGWLAQHPGRGGLLAGLAAGFMASMRPPDAAALLLTATLIAGVALLVQPRKLVRFLPLAILGCVVGISPFLAHNYWGTGEFLKPLYTVFAPEAVKFQMDVEVWKQRWSVVDSYRADFKDWAFDPIYLMPLVPALWLAPGTWRQRLLDLALVGVLPLVAINIAAFPWSGLHFNSYGPRYACMVLIPMALLVGRGAVAALAHPRLTLACFLGFAYLHKGQVEKHRVTYGDRITERSSLYRAMDASDARNVVVFMKTSTGNMDKGDLSRNDGENKNRVLYALDRGAAGNVEALHKMFPGRTAYVWSYEGAPGRGTLTQSDPTTGRPTGVVVLVRDAKPLSAFPPPPTRVPPPPYAWAAGEFYGQVGQLEGAEWNLWSNAKAAIFVELPTAGVYRFTAVMRGETCQGVPPHVVVEVDGVKKQELDPPAGAAQPYVLEGLELQPGLHEISLNFTNDAKDHTGDRNLRIQKMTLELP